MQAFPIDSLKNEILQALERVDFLIIKYTPGSGKTTRVPLFLSERYKNKIYILEPRKLAAKLASGFVAQLRQEKPGQSVGHIFKYEKVVSPQTQIIFLTEGTFLRILASDPELKDGDVVILDEFHERHYHTDVAFSFLKKIKETNKKLKIVIMSATINLAELEGALCRDFETIELHETKHQLRIDHLPNNTLVLKEPLERKIYQALLELVKREGHILIFLSGMAEIRRCEEMIKRSMEYEVIILHGDLAGVHIDESFYDLEKKKIILSTNIAESSVTIPGVRQVIDSGLHKISRMNPVTRLPMVESKKISQSSAIQRAARAARESDGYALRLYSEQDFLSRDLFDTPEINRSDLSHIIMLSSDLFHAPLEDFAFVTPLKELEIKRSRDNLEQMAFLKNGMPTLLAQQLAKLPFHPRISKILDEAAHYDSESFNQVIHYLSELVEPKNPARFRALAKNYFSPKASGKSADLEKVILAGYPDQISKLSTGLKLVHISGESYSIASDLHSHLDLTHELWIILDLNNRNEVTKLLPIEEEWLYDLPHFPLEETEKVDFNVDLLKLSVEKITHIGAIVLSRDRVLPDKISESTLSLVAKKVLPAFKEKMEDDTFKRIEVLEKYTDKKITDFDFSPWFKEQISYLLQDSSYDLEKIRDLYTQTLFDFLNADGLYHLDTDLPLFLNLHDKRKVPIHYDPSNGVHCASYIQDFYGLKNAPSILKGKEKMKIHLLGPHKRALQVTQDLASFWEKTYKELYAEMKREYPRHYWPISPQEAAPILLLRNVRSSS